MHVYCIFDLYLQENRSRIVFWSQSNLLLSDIIKESLIVRGINYEVCGDALIHISFVTDIICALISGKCFEISPLS